MRSDPGSLVRVDLESKQYKPSTDLPLDALLAKLTEASTSDHPPDVWILATTRPIDSTYREKLQAHGESLGIGVIVWDWPGGADVLSDLAVVCAAAPEACRSHLSPTPELRAALDWIRGAA